MFDSTGDIVGLHNSDGVFIFAVMAECKMFVEFEPTLPNFTISVEIQPATTDSWLRKGL